MDHGGGSAGYSDHNIVANTFIFLCSNGMRPANARRNVVTGNRINTRNFGVNMQGFGGQPTAKKT